MTAYSDKHVCIDGFVLTPFGEVAYQNLVRLNSSTSYYREIDDWMQYLLFSNHCLSKKPVESVSDRFEIDFNCKVLQTGGKE